MFTFVRKICYIYSRCTYSKIVPTTLKFYHQMQNKINIAGINQGKINLFQKNGQRYTEFIKKIEVFELSGYFCVLCGSVSSGMFCVFQLQEKRLKKSMNHNKP